MRIWRVCKAAGRPFPQFSDDPFIDYLIIEAVYSHVLKQDKELAKQQKVKEWKQRGKEDLTAALHELDT